MDSEQNRIGLSSIALYFVRLVDRTNSKIDVRLCSITEPNRTIGVRLDYSIKRESRHFHVVVVQKGAKKCTKQRDAPADLLFCSLNLSFFLRSCRRPRRWILKFLVSIVMRRH